MCEQWSSLPVASAFIAIPAIAITRCWIFVWGGDAPSVPPAVRQQNGPRLKAALPHSLQVGEEGKVIFWQQAIGNNT
jgi:hypothetical protein